MLCPVCQSQHDARPIKCLQEATLDHVSQCGISTDHSGNCLLKLLNIYVQANPDWKKGIQIVRYKFAGFEKLYIKHNTRPLPAAISENLIRLRY